MTIDDMIRDEKLQYDINREVIKTSALSSGEIDKYEYLTDETILPFDQSRMIEQANFTYSPLGKTWEKQTKTIEDQGRKQVEHQQKPKLIERIIPKELGNNGIKNKLNEIKNLKKNC